MSGENSTDLTCSSSSDEGSSFLFSEVRIFFVSTTKIGASLLLISQIAALPRRSTVAICLESGENLADFTATRCLNGVRTPVLKSRTWAESSSLLVTSQLPSGENSAVLTSQVCTTGAIASAPVFTSNTLAALLVLRVLSAQAIAIALPLGENFAETTSS